MSQVKENTKSIKTCFVVTPIGKPDSEIRRHIDGLIKVAIKPALGEDYEVRAAHDYVDSMSITKQVYEKLYESDLVIVNLTGLNPNVMYELGIRFCFGKPVILIAKEGEQLPFDITEYRTAFYKDDALGFCELKEELEKVKKTIKYNGKEKSPIHDSLKEVNLFKQLDATSDKNEVSETLSLIMKRLDILSEKNEKPQVINTKAIDFLTLENLRRILKEIKSELEICENNYQLVTYDRIYNLKEDLTDYFQNEETYKKMLPTLDFEYISIEMRRVNERVNKLLSKKSSSN